MLDALKALAATLAALGIIFAVAMWFAILPSIGLLHLLGWLR